MLMFGLFHNNGIVITTAWETGALAAILSARLPDAVFGLSPQFNHVAALPQMTFRQAGRAERAERRSLSSTARLSDVDFTSYLLSISGVVVWFRSTQDGRADTGGQDRLLGNGPSGRLEHLHHSYCGCHCSLCLVFHRLIKRS